MYNEMGIVSNIGKAARDRRTVTIQYKDKKGVISERETEPYEIRDDAYFGYDVDGGSIKRFSLSGILSARQTENGFTPRWIVKF